MLEKGGFSFIALLVINPIAILLYQNLVFQPLPQGELASREISHQRRTISSVATPKQVDISSSKVVKPSIANCDSAHQNCPVASIE